MIYSEKFCGIAKSILMLWWMTSPNVPDSSGGFYTKDFVSSGPALAPIPLSQINKEIGTGWQGIRLHNGSAELQIFYFFKVTSGNSLIRISKYFK